MGPPLRKELSTSIEWCKDVLEGTKQSISGDSLGSVDVREVAQAHLLGMKNKEAANKRFILCQGVPCYHDYAKPVIDKYTPLGWPCTQQYDERQPITNSFNVNASKELGVKYRDFNTTMLDMAEKLIELGIAKKP